MKLSKLALLPLLALVLGSCTVTPPASSESGDTTGTTSQTETTTESETSTEAGTTTEEGTTTEVAPTTWSEEELALIKGALNDNVLPYFHYEGGSFEVSEEEGLNILTYTVVEPGEAAKTELITLFEADGFVKNEQASKPEELVFNKGLDKYYLDEQIIMTLFTGKTPTHKTYLGMSWFYLAQEQVTTWPTAELAELLGAFGCLAPLPAPSFEFTHYRRLDYSVEEQTLVLGLFTGDFTTAYVRDLLLAGYTVDAVYLEDDLPAFRAINDLVKVQTILYYDAELDVTVILATYAPTTHWYGTFYSAQVEKQLGIKGLYLPEPTFKLYDATLAFMPVDQNDPTKGVIGNLIMITDDPKAHLRFAQTLTNQAYFVVLSLPQTAEEPIVLIDSATKTIVAVHPYIAESHALLVQIIGKGSPVAAEQATLYVQALQAAVIQKYGDASELPALPVEGLYCIDITPVEGSLLVKVPYDDPVAAGKVYVAAFTEDDGWTVTGDIATGVVRAFNKVSGLSVNIIADVEIGGIYLGIKGAPKSWEEALPAESYKQLVAVFGENVEAILPYAGYKAANAEILGAEVEATAGTIVYGNAASPAPLTDADLAAYKAALVAAGWTLVEDGGKSALYTREINGVAYALMVSLDDAASSTAGLFVIGWEQA